MGSVRFCTGIFQKPLTHAEMLCIIQILRGSIKSPRILVELYNIILAVARFVWCDCVEHAVINIRDIGILEC
jgi:hypothetical protein